MVPVTILSYGFWQRRFGADESVLGKTITLNNQSFTVIGVTPANFQFGTVADVFVPIRLSAERLEPGEFQFPRKDWVFQIEVKLHRPLSPLAFDQDSCAKLSEWPVRPPFENGVSPFMRKHIRDPYPHLNGHFISFIPTKGGYAYFTSAAARRCGRNQVTNIAGLLGCTYPKLIESTTSNLAAMKRVKGLSATWIISLVSCGRFPNPCPRNG